MNVFSILLVTYLLGLCHCKGSRAITDRPVMDELDDYREDEVLTSDFVEEIETHKSSGPSGQRQVWDLSNGTVYEDSRALTHSRHTTILDLVSPNSSQCQSFDYSFTSNAIRLIVPNKGVSVSKLMNDTEEVYTLSSGQTFDHAKAYLNQYKRQELVLITLRTSSSILEKAYSKNGSKWESCNNSNAKMKSLVSTAKRKSGFELDISLDKDIKECSIFEAELLGVTTKHFFPKPGHDIIKVKDGDKELWEGGYDDYCRSCLIYKNGNIELLEMVVVERLSMGWKCFEKTAGEWKYLTRDDFLNKLNEMSKSGSSPNPSSSHPSKTSE